MAKRTAKSATKTMAVPVDTPAVTPTIKAPSLLEIQTEEQHKTKTVRKSGQAASAPVVANDDSPAKDTDEDGFWEFVDKPSSPAKPSTIPAPVLAPTSKYVLYAIKP